MSGLNVVSSNQLLTASWDISASEVTGELIFNHLAQKTYSSIILNDVAFQTLHKEQAVVNGDIYNVLLITYDVNGGIVRKLLVQNVCGKTVPGVVSFNVEVRNASLAIQLLNYNASADEVNGYSLITDFEVFIDNGNNVDYILKYGIAKITNGKLIINDMNNVNSESPNLVNGTNYEIVIRAVNAMGKGPFGTPKYGKPTFQTANVTNPVGVEKDRSVLLSWTPSDALYNFTYTIKKRLRTESSWTLVEDNLSKTVADPSNVQIPRSSYLVPNLSNGTYYDFLINAVSSEYGVSLDGLVENKRPYTVPAMMDNTNVEITDLSNSTIRVKLTPPAINGGKAVTQFHFAKQSDLGNNLATLIDASGIFIVGPLANGEQVTFQVKSKNDATNNWSPVYSFDYTQYANPSAVTMSTPTNATVTGSNDGKVNLTWSLPALNNRGGASPADFTHTIEHNAYDLSGSEYVADPSNVFVDVTNATSREISGLVLGKSYNFKIKSKFNKNSVDFVSPNSTELIITPYSIPDAPAPAIDMSGAQMMITWNEPNLYNLALRKYEYAIKLKNSQASLVYFTASSTRQQMVDPTAYGQIHQLYMKTYTILPGSCSDLVSAVSAVYEYTPYKAPSAVQDFVLYPLEGAIEVRWSEPADKGGYPSLKYRVAVNNEIRTTISQTSTKITGLSSDATFIGVVPVGFLDGQEKLAGPATYNYAYPYSDPEAPEGLELTPGDNKIKLQWVASTSSIQNLAEGSVVPVISYIIFRNDVRLSGVDVSGGVVEYEDRTVSNGTVYSYRVISKQTFPDGKITYSDNFTSADDVVSATPFKNPEAPRSLVLVSEDQQIRANWTAPLSLNGLSSPAFYKIEVRDTSTNNIVLQTEQNALTITISGLTNGQQYNVKVLSSAENKEDNVSGWYDSLSYLSGNVTPNMVPNAPRDVVCVAGDRQATLSWSVALSDSYTTTGYKIYKDGSKIADLGAEATSYVINTQLVNGTSYVFEVSRVIAELSGAESSKAPASAVVPYGKPLSPIVTRSNDKKQVSLTVDRNGSSITDFIVFVVPKTYASSNVLIHKDSPLASPDSLVSGNFTKVTNQLVVDEVVAAYVIVSNAAGMLVQPVSFEA